MGRKTRLKFGKLKFASVILLVTLIFVVLSSSEAILSLNSPSPSDRKILPVQDCPVSERINANYDCGSIMFWEILHFYRYEISMREIYGQPKSFGKYNLTTRWMNLYMNKSITDEMRLQMTRTFVTASINRGHPIYAAVGAAKGVLGQGHAFTITGYDDGGNVIYAHMWSGQPNQPFDILTFVLTYHLVEMWEVYPKESTSMPTAELKHIVVTSTTGMFRITRGEIPTATRESYAYVNLQFKNTGAKARFSFALQAISDEPNLPPGDIIYTPHNPDSTVDWTPVNAGEERVLTHSLHFIVYGARVKVWLLAQYEGQTVTVIPIQEFHVDSR